MRTTCAYIWFQYFNAVRLPGYFSVALIVVPSYKMKFILTCSCELPNLHGFTIHNKRVGYQFGYLFYYFQANVMFAISRTAMLVCSWFNILLYTAEIGLTMHFFMNHKSGSFYKWSLLLALAFDTAFTAVNCYNVYLVCFNRSLGVSPAFVVE